ncbi:Peroxisomal bioproteinsis factor 11 [Sphaceloma murrayae]|uniref:Peroxisomal bioproteinsis factor 11 n=1 Tax=Sphaceloma murrayae TaxID=2082308 RepID=A0A2K1QIZ6_9PEZI|nr:Peroxisomal bioproteinsis factor 11 [Sphaceloma murrayae]
MVADSLVYHPSVTHFNNYVATTVGRDKALRTVQYFSRFLSFYLYRQNYSQATVNQFTALKTNLGLVRKAMRLGKFVEHLRAAALAYDSKTLDPILKYLAVARQMGYAGYLLTDTLTYLDAAGVRKSESAKSMQRQAYQFWALGLAASVVSGVYSLYKIQTENKSVIENQGTDAEKKVEGKKVLRDRTAATQQLVSDLCDLTVPSSALGWADLDDGIVGLAGTVSSLIALNTQWKKTAPPS